MDRHVSDVGERVLDFFHSDGGMVLPGVRPSRWETDMQCMQVKVWL
jgi:hypothetical protein